MSLDDRKEFIRRLLQIATLVPVLSEIADCWDPTDNKILAVAVDAGASCIISGEKDLQMLHPWRSIEIVALADFLARED